MHAQTYSRDHRPMSLPITGSYDCEPLEQPTASIGVTCCRTARSQRCLIATSLVLAQLSIVLAAAGLRAGGILFQAYRSIDKGITKTCYGRYECELLD